MPPSWREANKLCRHSKWTERFGHWHACKGQEKKAGIHSQEGKWRLVTRDKEKAISTAKARME